MKKIFLCFLLLCAGRAFAAQPVKIKNWNTVQTYDVATLNKNIESQIRKIVGVRFDFRGKDIHHFKPNWYESTIFGRDPDGTKGFVSVKVMVAKKDLRAFKALPTEPSSAEPLTAYGEVLRDADSHFMFLRLLGSKATPNPDGSATVSW
jgi:hypothetical protein